MNIDDILKIILVLAISVSLVGISFEIMRLIGKLADTIQDLRRAAQNLGNASDMVVEDYDRLRKLLHSLMDIVENFEQNILSPAKLVSSLVQKFITSKQADEPADDSTL